MESQAADDSDFSDEELFNKKPAPNFGESLYWEKRYNLEQTDKPRDYSYDWYLTVDKIKAILETYFDSPKGQRVLVLGCGSSTLSAALFEYGFRVVTSLDVSPVVITRMQQRYRGLEGLDFVVGDARRLDAYQDGHFDFVIDKGLMDSFLCGFRPELDVLEMHSEVLRVLRPEGVFLCVSYGDPVTRLHYFEHPSLTWNCSVTPLPDTLGIVMYACTKRSTKVSEAANMKAAQETQKKSVMPGTTQSLWQKKDNVFTPENTIMRIEPPKPPTDTKLLPMSPVVSKSSAVTNPTLTTSIGLTATELEASRARTKNLLELAASEGLELSRPKTDVFIARTLTLDPSRVLAGDDGRDDFDTDESTAATWSIE